MGYEKSPFEPDAGAVYFERDDPFDAVMIDLDEDTDLSDFENQCDLIGVDFQTFLEAVNDLLPEELEE